MNYVYLGFESLASPIFNMPEPLSTTRVVVAAILQAAEVPDTIPATMEPPPDMPPDADWERMHEDELDIMREEEGSVARFGFLGTLC